MFEFTEEDLKSNKCGILTKGQREYLKMIGEGGVRVQGWNIKTAFGFIFLGLCNALGLDLQNEDTRAALFSISMDLLLFPATILVLPALPAFGILFARLF